MGWVLAGLLLASFVQAGDAVFGEWQSGSYKEDFFFALTENKAGASMGQFCFPDSGNCMYLFDLQLTCDDGDTIPAVINSDVGTLGIEFMCSIEYQDRRLFMAQPFDEINLIVKKAAYLRIAIPVGKGKFKVNRFGMIGSSKAVEHMRRRAWKAMGSSKPLPSPVTDMETI